MPLKVECVIPGLEENFLEFGEVWTRRDAREWAELAGADVLPWIVARLVGCHLARPGQEPLTDPAELTEESLDAVDLRLVEFVGSAPTTAMIHLRQMGKLSGRPSSATFGPGTKSGGL